MPWVEPNPSREQVDEWQYFNGGLAVPIAWWPHSNTLRVNPRYRCIETQPQLIPLASRYGLYYRLFNLPYSEDPQELFGFWHGDLLVKGDNHIGVTTEVNKDGYTLDIDVQHFQSLPENEEPGYEFKTTWHKVGLNSRTYREEYPTAHVAGRWRHNMNTFVRNQNENQFWEFPPGPTIPQFTSQLFGVTECFEFPIFPPGFAAFNGVDAYIALDHDITRFNDDFVIDVDVRLHNITDHWPLLGREAAGGFIGMEGPFFIFHALKVFTPFVPVLNEWFQWRVEYEQEAQLNIKLFINDVEMSSNIINVVNTPFNRIGVYRHGMAGTLWAHADFKNLKVFWGDAPSTDVELDMPLFANALDLGPEGNHGTTFNMPLPSV